MQDIQMGFDYNEKDELITVQKNDPYRFDLDQHGFPVFSDKNLRFVWAMVENNSAYNSVKDKRIKEVYKLALEGNPVAINQAVYLTDAINSTHLSVLGKAYSDAVDDEDSKIKSVEAVFGKCTAPDPSVEPDETPDQAGKPVKKIELQKGRLLTAKGILDNHKGLVQRMEKGDPQVVSEIAHYSKQYAKKELGIEIKKNNFSFASKFCHYACVNGFEEEKIGRDRDLYPIYDSVVTQVLPYYIWAYSEKVEPSKHGRCNTKYRILEKFLEDCRSDDNPAGYQQFRSYYDSVIKGIDRWREDTEQSGLNVRTIGEKGAFSYRHVDRLIWYYFKGRRLVEAKKKFINLIEW